MARIVVIGGTGYAGRHIVQEAVSRGHEVVSISRSVPENPVEGATVVPRIDGRRRADRMAS